jgi:biopolymer transport protein ExbB
MHVIGQLKQALVALHAAWVMWLLFGLFVMAIAIAVERILFLRSVRVNIGSLSDRIDGFLREGRLRDAIAALLSSKAAAAAVALAGLKSATRGAEAAQRAMEGARALERIRLERGLSFLGTLGNNAPFLGLLGTVIGIIEAFEALGAAQAGTSIGGGGALAPEAVMSGIAEALVATAVGLFIALPCVAAYNSFQRKIQTLLAETDALSALVLSHLSGESWATTMLPKGGE